MPAIVTCPKCKTKYQLPDTMLGKPIKCKSCGTAFKTKSGSNPAGNQSGTPATATKPKIPASSNPQPAAGDLAKFGLDGPLRRQPDLFAGAAPLTRQSPDILGNRAADPGFADLRADPIAADISERPTNDLSEITQNPYLPPSVSGSGKGKPDRAGGSKAQGDPNYKYKSLKVIAIFVCAGVAISCLAVFATMILATFFIPSDETIEAAGEGEIGKSVLAFIGAVVFLLGTQAVSLIFTAVMLCIFMYRGNANVRALGATGLQVSPGWSVGFWFIPFANLYKPVQSMSEIYRASMKPRGKSWQKLGTPGVIAAWWTFWLVGNFLSRLEWKLDEETVGMGAYNAIVWGNGISHLIGGIMLIMIVSTISKNQAQRAG